MSMRDLRDCSGPWKGFWTQDLVRGHMRLNLAFSGNNINGGGSDPIGSFEVSGIFSDETLRVLFTKTYRTHTVEYSGVWDGHFIYGRWTLHDEQFTEIGEFEIWPEDTREMVESATGSIGEAQRNPLGL